MRWPRWRPEDEMWDQLPGPNPPQYDQAFDSDFEPMYREEYEAYRGDGGVKVRLPCDDMTIHELDPGEELTLEAKNGKTNWSEAKRDQYRESGKAAARRRHQARRDAVSDGLQVGERGSKVAGDDRDS